MNWHCKASKAPIKFSNTNALLYSQHAKYKWLKEHAAAVADHVIEEYRHYFTIKYSTTKTQLKQVTSLWT